MAKRDKKSQHPVTATPTLTLAESAEKITEQAAELVNNIEDAVDAVNNGEIPSARQTVTARCQEAKENSCSCRCRGKYHGKEHPAGWKDEEGCEPLTKEERKVAKRDALNAWRQAHPDRVSAYMKQWRETSDAPTAVAMRSKEAKRAEAAKLTPLESEQTQPEAETVAQA